jgi:ABC-type antimicrobial peptide transport system permease subunit
VTESDHDPVFVVLAALLWLAGFLVGGGIGIGIGVAIGQAL